MTAAAPTLPGITKPGANPKEKFSLCIYGRGGTGKTTLLGTMPGRGLVIDVTQVEGGTFVLENEKDRIDVFSIESWDQIDPVYWYLNKGGHKYDWVAIDSITGMTQLAIKKTIGDRPDALIIDPHTISLQEWGKVGRLCGELIYKFRTLPLHTIWVAQERKFGGNDGEPTVTGPDVSPATLQMLLPPMILVGRLFVEYSLDGTTERHFRIKPHSEYHAKVRARPNLDVPAVVKNPSLSGILKYILGSGTRPDEVKDDAFMLLG